MLNSNLSKLWTLISKDRYLYLVTRLANSLLGIFLSYLIIRFQDKSTYAELAQIISLSTVLVALSDFGYLKTVQIDAHQSKIGFRDLESTLTIILKASSLFVIIAALTFVFLGYKIQLVLVALFLLLSYIKSYKFLAQNKLFLNALFQGIIFTLILVLTAIISDNFWSDLTVIILIVTVTFLLSFKFFKNAKTNKLNYFLQNKRRSLNIYVTHVSGILLGNLDILMFGILVPAEILSDYIVITRMSKFIFLIQNIINQSFSKDINSHLATDSPKEALVLLRRLSLYILTAGVAMSLGFVFFGNELLKYWDIHNSIVPLILSAVLLTCTSSLGLISDYLIYIGNEVFVRRLSVVSVILTVPAYLIVGHNGSLLYLVGTFGGTLLLVNLCKLWKIRSLNI